MTVQTFFDIGAALGCFQLIVLCAVFALWALDSLLDAIRFVFTPPARSVDEWDRVHYVTGPPIRLTGTRVCGENGDRRTVGFDVSERWTPGRLGRRRGPDHHNRERGGHDGHGA